MNLFSLFLSNICSSGCVSNLPFPAAHRKLPLMSLSYLQLHMPETKPILCSVPQPPFPLERLLSSHPEELKVTEAALLLHSCGARRHQAYQGFLPILLCLPPSAPYPEFQPSSPTLRTRDPLQAALHSCQRDLSPKGPPSHVLLPTDLL